MKKLMYVIMIVFGLMMSLFAIDYENSKQKLELLNPLATSGYIQKEARFNEVTQEKAKYFYEVMFDLVHEYDVNVVYKVDTSEFEGTDYKQNRYYFSNNDLLNDYFAGLSGRSDLVENDNIYTKLDDMPNSIKILDVIEINFDVTFIPLALASTYETSTSGSLLVTGKDEEVIGNFVNELVRTSEVTFDGIQNVGDYGYVNDPQASIFEQLEYDFIFIYLCLYTIIVIFYIYTLNVKRKDMVIRKSLGYSNIRVMLEMTSKYLALPVLVSFCLFAVYGLIHGMRWNITTLMVFKLFSIMYLILIALLMVVQLVVYISLTRISNVELLKGRKIVNSLNYIVTGFKLVILPFFVIFAIITAISFNKYYQESTLYNYYKNDLPNYQMLYRDGDDVMKDGFYDKLLTKLKENTDAVFSISEPVYLGGYASEEFSEYMTAYDSLKDNLKYRINISEDFLKHFEIKGLDSGKDLVFNPDDNVLFVSENIRLDEDLLKNEGYQIIRVKSKPLPNFFAYKGYVEPTLEEFVLHYSRHSLSASQIIADMSRISSDDLIKALDKTCDELGINNSFEFKGMETEHDFSIHLYKGRFNKLLISFILLISSCLTINYFCNYIHFEEHKKELAIKKSMGYSYIDKYKNIVITNFVVVGLAGVILFVFFDQLIKMLSFNYFITINQIQLEVIIVVVEVFLLEYIVNYVMFKLLERNTLLNIKA